MSGVRHRKHEIEHRGILLRLIPVLLEHARAVRESVPDGGVEIRDDALEQRACRIGHGQKLVLAECRGQVWKCLVSMRDCGARGWGQPCAWFRDGLLRGGWWWL